jgi:uncharacterized phage-like protein YoqJ
VDKIACFTGHRPQKIGGYVKTNPMRVRVRKALEVAIDRAVAAGYTKFISGMALGVDQDAAEICIEKGLYLIAAVPCKGVELRWPESSQRDFRAILAGASEVDYGAEFYAGPKTMQDRNEWMAVRSSLVIAVWDGSKGGTYNMLEYCKSRTPRPAIWRINPVM